MGRKRRAADGNVSLHEVINEITLAVAAHKSAGQQKHLYLPQGQNMVLPFFFCPGIA